MNRELRVGLMFAVSAVIFAVALFYLGNFREMVSYKIRFERVSGLAVDSPVHFNGVPVGRVTRIELSEEPNEQGGVPIMVTIGVDRSARQHIRYSTQADIRTVGVLGDKMISLETKSYQSEVMEEDGIISLSPKIVDVDKLLAQGTDMVSDVTEITEDLKTLLKQVTEGEGVMQALITDKTMTDQLRNTLQRAVSYLDNDENLLSLVLKDSDFATKMKTDLETMTRDVSSLVSQMKDAKGLVPTMMQDEAYKKQLLSRLDEITNLSLAYIEKMSEGRGLLYKLTQDEEYGTRVAANLEKASYHLASILEKIDQGDGTAAMIVNDPSLYEGIYEVVYGLQHSGVTKWYIQRKQRKGEKLLQKEEKEDSQ